MNEHQRDTLASCLTQVFGRVEDSFIEAALPLLRWIELAAGETLFEEGDPEDGVYFIISGRLRALTRDEGGLRPINEMGRGEPIGEMAVLTGESRSATVMAIRDSVLAHATRESFEELWRRHPELPLHMARIVITRLKRSGERRRAMRPSTLCLLAVTDGIDVQGFGERLVAALERWGVTTLETSARVDERFGPGTADTARDDSEAHLKLTLWLDDLEFWNENVVLAADLHDSQWTRRCLRHADEVLLLARADAPARLHPIEEYLCSADRPITGARQILILIHDDETTHPKNTSAWLDRRPVDGHYHLRQSSPRDIARLARIVTGNAVGLVLGGGGARGFAHLGVYRALEEAGVAVDLVAGTSIGAAMAALISFDLSSEELINRARAAFAGNPTGDIAVPPMLSLVKGGRLRRTIERGVREAVGSLADVVDSWRTLRCVASNYSRAREHVIARGPLDRAVRASVSIPVALPPVPWDGDLLIDGGVFNNFPTDVAEAMGAGRIIGVDLSRMRARRLEIDEIPGTSTLFLDRLRGRRRRYRLPSLGSILMGTTILYSESRREQASRSADIYLNPDLGRIGLLEWTAFDRILDVGYRHAKEVLEAMSEDELAPYRDLELGPAARDDGAESDPVSP